MIEMLAAFCAAFAFDQWSKHVVRTRLPREGFRRCRGLRVRYVANSRAEFRRASTQVTFALGWSLSLTSILVLHFFAGWFSRGGALAGLGLALGGAAGNLSDIVRLHHVADFVDLGWWPVFNGADAAIVGGLAVAFWPRA